MKPASHVYLQIAVCHIDVDNGAAGSPVLWPLSGLPKDRKGSCKEAHGSSAGKCGTAVSFGLEALDRSGALLL